MISFTWDLALFQQYLILSFHDLFILLFIRKQQP